MPPTPSTTVQSRKGCRFFAFVAAVAAALVWNALLFSAYQDYLGGTDRWVLANWLWVVMLMPFAAVGAGLVGIAVYLGVPLANPRLRFEVFPSRSGPGDTVEVAWEFQGPIDKIAALTIHLEAREEATRSTRSGLHTKVEAFRRLPVARLSDPDRIRSGGLSYRLPEDAVPSHSGRKNRITWYFCIYSGVGRWPQVRQELEYPIQPTRK